MNTSVEYIALEQTHSDKLCNSKDTTNDKDSCNIQQKTGQNDLMSFEEQKQNMESSKTKELQESDGLLENQKQTGGTKPRNLKDNKVIKSIKDGPAAKQKSKLLGKILKTISIDAAYFGAALSLGIIGPSLMDLEDMTNTTGSEIALIFTVRGILAIVGSIALAPILEYFNRYMLVGISLLFTGLLTLLAPLSRSLPAILLTLGPPEFFGCALGMGTHLLCVEIWRSGAGPFLQLLNFVSITGFAVAPLIVRPFLSPTIPPLTTAIPYNTTHNQSQIDCNSTTNGGDFVGCVSIASEEREMTLVYVAYIIVGVYCLLAAVIFVVIIYFDKSHRSVIRKAVSIEEENKSTHSYSRVYLGCLYIQFYFLILFYGGIEVGFCGLAPTFAVRHLNWSKGDAALLATVVQGFNAFFTALGIFLSYIMSPKTIVLVDALIVALTLIILELFVEQYNFLLWICSAFLGIGSASIMPSAYTWANDLFEINGIFNGFYWCGFFSGFMIMPAIAGSLMHTYGYMWFCHVFMVCGLLVVAIFLCLVSTVKLWEGTKEIKSPAEKTI